MTPLKIHLFVWFAAAILVLTAPQAVSAESLNKGTIANFDQPIEIPGLVLPAGSYAFIERGPLVQVWDRDQTKLYATLITNAAEQSRFVDERQEFEFEKQGSDSPPELKSWFLDGGIIGHEFIYRK